jgi:chorismate mutase
VEEMNTDLIALRDKITEIDNEILELLEERMFLSGEIGELKKESGMKIEDLDYEKKMIEGRKLHVSLDSSFVEDLFKLILKESKRKQWDLNDGGESLVEKRESFNEKIINCEDE